MEIQQKNFMTNHRYHKPRIYICATNSTQPEITDAGV